MRKHADKHTVIKAQYNQAGLHLNVTLFGITRLFNEIQQHGDSIAEVLQQEGTGIAYEALIDKRNCD
ncbi:MULTISPECIES: hypothetical protein [Acinetobacter]|uniref:hypothetical protein n=1 Tax=Acinetobacter TaxID=469 RepID=UPI0005C4F5C1|nr:MULTISPECIES: hypothetical protein [Acinetobacter]